MAGETYAFADAFYMSNVIKHDMENTLYVRLPLIMMTYSESLFKFIVKSSTTTEK